MAGTGRNSTKRTERNPLKHCRKMFGKIGAKLVENWQKIDLPNPKWPWKRNSKMAAQFRATKSFHLDLKIEKKIINNTKKIKKKKNPPTKSIKEQTNKRRTGQIKLQKFISHWLPSDIWFICSLQSILWLVNSLIYLTLTCRHSLHINYSNLYHQLMQADRIGPTVAIY